MSYKKLIVVGNGANILQQRNGHLIDSFDYVVRMNGCKIIGYEEYTGTKTDMYRAPWDRMLSYVDTNECKINDADVLPDKHFLFPIDEGIQAHNFLFIEPDIDNFYETANWHVNHIRFKHVYGKSILVPHRFYEFISKRMPERLLHDYFLPLLEIKYNVKYIYYMTLKQRAEIFYKFNSMFMSEHFSKRLFLPSSGIFTLLYIIEKYSSEYEIWVTGYNSFATGMYWNDWDVSDKFYSVHSRLHERTILKRLITQKIINQL